MAGLGLDLRPTLSALDELAANPWLVEDDVLPPLQYELHCAIENAAGLTPPEGAGEAHRELAQALADARDATAEIWETYTAGGLDAIQRLVWEWRVVLFRVRSARAVSYPRWDGTPETGPVGPSPRRWTRCRCRHRPRGFAAGRGWRSSARWTRWRRLSRCRAAPARAADPRERLLPAQQLQRLEQARRHLRARHRDPDRLKRLRGLQARLLRQLAQNRLDLVRAPVLDPAESVSRGRQHLLVEEDRIRLRRAEEEAREPRIVAELLDLRLDQRDCPAHEFRVPVVPVVAEPEQQLVDVVVLAQAVQVHALSPVALVVVERRG